MLALFAGLIMFLPTAYFRARRRLAVRLSVGGLIAFIAGLIMTPTPPKADKMPAASSSPITAPSPDSKPSAPAIDKGTQAEFIAMYRHIIETAKPCDKSVDALGKAAKTGNVYSTYQVAKDGAEACRDASTSIGEMETPGGLPSEAADAVGKAIEVCRNAYLYRQLGMEKAMQAADGDARPSVMSEMAENMKTAQHGVILCVAQLFMTSQAVGVDPKILN